ncbi:MAG: adenylate/guanylate cyclase domain-containing protein [Candidatus Binatus sp.]|uniref:adenylate/guanylate cyclase domain-containing protein n=1 Tax=Candidatus Binatus sp. TaxID=2811406 RepID=UPI003BB1BCFD
MEAQTKYAKSGDVHIAYRVFGDSPRDIVLMPGTLSHVELYWELPANEYILKRLTSFARVIVFDKRGQGLSDRVAEQTLEERIGDVLAVLDAAGSKRATVFGWSEGGPMSLMFTATYPERTTALVMFNTFASMKAEPWALGQEQFDRFLGALDAHWGEGVLVGINAPSLRKDKAFVQWFGRLERASSSPGGIQALFRADYESDVRHVLPSIQVPTLILHRKGDSLVPVAVGRDMAQKISGAKYVELPGEDHLLQALPPDLLDRLLDEIEEFITGTRHSPDPDRVLATVMFTDIVRSTERAAEMGDSKWRALLADYYAAVRKELSVFRGREVNTAGDGLLATFDGPNRAIRCACSVRERLRALGLEVRTGLHTGECELIGDDIGGIAVHIAARVASKAEPDEVLVSSTVRDIVAGSGLRFADRGMHALKGVPEEWHLFLVQ